MIYVKHDEPFSVTFVIKEGSGYIVSPTYLRAIFTVNGVSDYSPTLVYEPTIPAVYDTEGLLVTAGVDGYIRAEGLTTSSASDRVSVELERYISSDKWQEARKVNVKLLPLYTTAIISQAKAI